MTDRPSLEQLIDAVRLHLESVVIPAVRSEPKLYFQTLVAANVLKIAQREVTDGQALIDAEWTSLDALTEQEMGLPTHHAAVETLMQRNRALTVDIRAGKYDEPVVSNRLALHVERVVNGQLMLNAPALAQRLRAEDESGEHPS